MPTNLPSGLYEDLMTLGLSEAVDAARTNGRPIQTRTLPDAGDAAMVAQWLKMQMERYLRDLPAEHRAVAQVEVANRVLEVLLADSHQRRMRGQSVLAEDALSGGGILEHVLDAASDPGFPRPATPLSQPVLLTGSHGEPSLGNEYQLELGSTDRVDALVSFVTWGGWLQSIAAHALSGETEASERTRILKALRKGELRMVFTCDLLNEGIDIPEVDTLLFLRPTASATVFQQQLGRGLRLSPGKEQTLVLDFVGRARREFRLDRPLAVLTGLHRGQLLNAFKGEGLPKLPRGCTLYLESQARAEVLENLKENLKLNVAKLRRELRDWLARSGNPPEPSLQAFLTETGTPLEDIWSKSAGGRNAHGGKAPGHALFPVQDFQAWASIVAA